MIDTRLDKNYNKKKMIIAGVIILAIILTIFEAHSGYEGKRLIEESNVWNYYFASRTFKKRNRHIKTTIVEENENYVIYMCKIEYDWLLTSKIEVKEHTKFQEKQGNTYIFNDGENSLFIESTIYRRSFITWKEPKSNIKQHNL